MRDCPSSQDLCVRRDSQFPKARQSTCCFNECLTECQVLNIYIELGIAVRVEDTLVRSTCHRGDIPSYVNCSAHRCHRSCAVHWKNPEVSDEAMGNSIRLQSIYGQVFGLNLLPLNEFNSTDTSCAVAIRLIVEVVANSPYFKNAAAAFEFALAA